MKRKREKEKEKDKKKKKTSRPTKSEEPTFAEEAPRQQDASSTLFTDTDLTQKFDWKLKREKLISQGLDPDKVSKEQEKLRQLELRREIEKLKTRRLEREKEKELWEQERARLEREREVAKYDDWETKEEEFHLKQAKLRAEKRMAEGRPKLIDLMYKEVCLEIVQSSGTENEPQAIPIETLLTEPPYKKIEHLSINDLQEVQHDVAMFYDVDTKNTEYWSSLKVIVADLIKKQQREIEKKRGGGFVESSVVHNAVEDDLNAILVDKSYQELITLEGQINEKINSGEAMDEEYWAALLQRLQIFKAMAHLNDIHDKLKQQRLELRKQKSNQSSQQSACNKTTISTSITTNIDSTSNSDKIVTTSSTIDITVSSNNQLVGTTISTADNNTIPTPKPRSSLKNLQIETIVEEEPSVTHISSILSPDSNLSAKKEKRRLLRERLQTNRALTEDEMYKIEEEKGLDEEEEEFNVDFPVQSKRYAWQDKYKPRRPKYFNRVKSGYEWNKYNQTHYDIDNPPPKVVQGYKFNLFYPDLIDKGKAPQYDIDQIEDDPANVILKFHAGPPYEDIAFKIANKPWEYSHKKGFKCVFSNGVLHLWFDFRRFRYRR